MKGRIGFWIHLVAGAAAGITLLYLVAWKAPFSIKGIHDTYLIIFFHLPSAVNCLAFFLLGGIFSALYLWRRDLRNDVWACSAIAVGLLACTITLGTGSIWARAAWGKWWIWSDKRLLSVALTWFIFAGYFMLRWAVQEPHQRATYSGAFGLLAFVSVPLIHFSIKIFGPVSHPTNVVLDPPIGKIILFGMGTFLLVYLLIFRLLIRLEQSHRALEEIQEKNRWEEGH